MILHCARTKFNFLLTGSSFHLPRLSSESSNGETPAATEPARLTEITSEETELLNTSRHVAVRDDPLAEGRLQLSRRTKIKMMHEEFGKVPTPREIEEYVDMKLGSHRKEMMSLHKKRALWLDLSKEFWLAVKNDQVARLKSSLALHPPRTRTQPSTVRTQ